MQKHRKVCGGGGEGKLRCENRRKSRKILEGNEATGSYDSSGSNGRSSADDKRTRPRQAKNQSQTRAMALAKRKRLSGKLSQGYVPRVSSEGVRESVGLGVTQANPAGTAGEPEIDAEYILGFATWRTGLLQLQLFEMGY